MQGLTRGYCGEGAFMTIGKVFLAGLAAAVLIPAFDGDGFAEKFQKLPKAVQETANAHMGEAIPMKVASSQHGEGWDYQINTRLNGKMHNLVIDEKGALLAVKDEMDATSLPAAAISGLERQAGTAKIVRVEKVTEGAVVSYGAITKDEARGTVSEIRVAADGTPKLKNAK